MSKMFYLLFFILSIFKIHALEILSSDHLNLNKFFFSMLNETEGGYVLYGTKPVCITGYHINDCFSQENERHRSNVFLRQGAIKWKDLRLNQSQSNIIIHIYNNEDSFAKNWIHILFINKELFLTTVQSNLQLFQYVLGPDITPIKLLEKLIDPNSTFHSVLKEDKVLIGILLGYKAQNSLYVSRMEYLYQELFAAEDPPLRSQFSKLDNVPLPFRQMLLTKTNSDLIKEPNREPSFGYSSLKDELDAINQKITMSSPTLSANTPLFIFSRLKEDKETDKLIDALEQTQPKINQLLASNNFLKDVLQIIFPNESIIVHPINKKQIDFEEAEISQLPFLVGANIWRVIADEDQNYCEFFIAGMKDAENGIDKEDRPINYRKYEKLKALSAINKTLISNDSYFEQLNHDSTYTSILPNKLYYKTIREGTEETLENQTEVLVHYSIKTPNDQVVAATMIGGKAKKLSLSETIPGFTWGVKGMKIGEIREVIIHPSLAYGIYTTFDKAVYLKANVELVAINQDQKSINFPELTPLDLKSDITPTMNSEYEVEARKVAYQEGFLVWQHYKKSRLYSFSQVLEALNKFQDGADANISSEASQNIINRLHWNIYAA
jgi:FKBP-type peptidyl-prolyl cis-trans isomerase